MQAHAFCLLALMGVVSAACSSPQVHSTERDAQGNYASTSEYKSTQRSEFTTAMRAGLADFDKRRAELEERANKEGQESVNELHAYMPDLVKKRTTFVNEIARLEAALDKDWPARRETTQEAYDDLRDYLDEAYKKVLQ
jgi:hypothetical protein